MASRQGALVHSRLFARRLARAQVIPLAKGPACLVVVVTAAVLLLACGRSLRSWRLWTATRPPCGCAREQRARIYYFITLEQLHAGYEASARAVCSTSEKRSTRRVSCVVLVAVALMCARTHTDPGTTPRFHVRCTVHRKHTEPRRGRRTPLWAQNLCVTIFLKPWSNNLGVCYYKTNC